MITAPQIGRVRDRRGGRSSRHRRMMKRRIAGEQNWRCAYCHCDLDFETVTLDHVIPHSRGGRWIWENLVAACGDCNGSRGDKPAMEYWLARNSLSKLREELDLEFSIGRQLITGPSVRLVRFIEISGETAMAIAFRRAGIVGTQNEA